MTTLKFQCVERVPNTGGVYGHHRCRNAATIVEHEQHWCHAHAPSKVAEKAAARQAEWDAKWEAREAHAAKTAAIRRAELAVIEAARAQTPWTKSRQLTEALAALDAASQS